ncbi:unnamed protein product [Mytilus coruscus]|uniref:Uncharacterized protein n=1 Tax=Mytilus coruscus TaxID=42192 RepID=A0A6J8A255_MYTCO|nr:unnamed protein product [Mytilus coruscus]
MASTSQYALVLFDLHGETSIVQTQKLVPTSLVKEASRLHLQTSRKKYLVEVLELSDDDISLKSSQSKWSKSHRAIAIEKRTGQDGFLDVWPEDEEGSNGRQLSILHEGSGDNTKARVAPKRKPVYLQDLSSDEADLVNLQIANTSRNLMSIGVQTDTVVIISSDDKAAAFHQWQLSKKATCSTVSTMTQTLHPDLTSSAQQTDNLVETSAQQTDDLGQTLTSPTDVSIRSKRQLYPMSPEITIVNEKPTIQHQDNTNATNEDTDLIDILYHRTTTTTQDNPIATNDDQDSLDILLTTTTRDSPIATNDEQDSLDILLTTTTRDSPIATNDDQDSLDILLTTTTRDSPIATNDDQDSLDILLTTTTRDSPIATNDDQDSLDILLTTTTQHNTIATNDKTFQTTQHKLDKIISLLERNQEPRPSATPDDIVQSSEVEEQNQPTITQFYQYVNVQQPPTVFGEQTFDIVTPNNQTTVNNLTSTLVTPTSQSAHKTLKPCFTGSILELTSASDLLTMSSNQHTELRVGMTTMWEVQADSCSAGNFAWRLAKKLYTVDQLNGRNYSG